MSSVNTTSELTELEVRALDKFRFENCIDKQTVLINLLKRKSEKVKQPLYRGIKYRKEDLTIGAIYQHWNPISCWSLSKKVAVGFATMNCFSEELIESTALKRGYPAITKEIYNEIAEEFLHVVFKIEGASGFVVNNHHFFYNFSEEQEVILYEGIWKISEIKEVYVENSLYYEVTLK